MPGKKYFSYVRVSTQRQGESGTSLLEQQAAIERYAARFDLPIIKKYEERETAAKAGRPVFLEMLKQLRRGFINGVIIHKIDRSARNLKDWADLGSLIDSGLEVHFAAESLDLNSRGGRLSADIQAVVAADYIRNLREEVKKGFYGRLKQGLYPMPAPLGYVNNGQGQPKTPHPIYAPLIRKSFELYATGGYSISTLLKEMTRRGLRNKNDNRVSKNTFNDLLKNQFYTGLIKISKTGEVYRGKHEPLVSMKIFERVQIVMSGKTNDKQNARFFVFRGCAVCASCSHKLIPERQKGNTYYRCQKKHCPQKTVREELLTEGFCYLLKDLRFDERENEYLKRLINERRGVIESFAQTRRQTLHLQLEKCRERLSKLTDALIDGTLEKELFVSKKNSLILEEHRLQEELRNCGGTESDALERTVKILELANQAYLSYETGNEQEKREMVKTIVSNFFVEGKSVVIKPNLPFKVIVNRVKNLNGGARRVTLRTFEILLTNLVEHFKQ